MPRSFKSLLLATIIACIPATVSATEKTEDLDNFDLKHLAVSKPGDTEKTCGALSTEAVNMREVIFAAQDTKDRSELQGHGITAAGAVGSFLIGSVTGGIGLAVGGFLLDYNNDERIEKADEIQDIAAQRRTLMKGIYYAKECQGPFEYAMQDPEGFGENTRIAISDRRVYQTELRRRYNN